MPEVPEPNAKRIWPMTLRLSLDICIVSPLLHPCFVKGMAVQGRLALYLVEPCCEPIATTQALPVWEHSATGQSQHRSTEAGVQWLSLGG